MTIEKQSVKYLVTGGIPVHGTIKCMGAKNFATKAMVASLLTANQTTLCNIPLIGDVEITQKLLESLGVKITNTNDGTILIDPSDLSVNHASLPDSRTNRIPVLLLSVLLHKFDIVSVPLVGGDEIGQRNVDFHMYALQAFGAQVNNSGNHFISTWDIIGTECIWYFLTK